MKEEQLLWKVLDGSHAGFFQPTQGIIFIYCNVIFLMLVNIIDKLNMQINRIHVLNFNKFKNFCLPVQRV